MTIAVHIETENGPYADSPDSPLTLAHARKLRGMNLGLCISLLDGSVITGRSGSLVALQIDKAPSAKLNLPPLPDTWTVIAPGGKLQLWFTPPETGAGDLLPMQNRPAGVRALRNAPIPGDGYKWGPTNPWTSPAPAPLPLEWWNVLPKKKIDNNFSGYLNHKQRQQKANDL